jgi:hypothetical protein
MARRLEALERQHVAIEARMTAFMQRVAGIQARAMEPGPASAIGGAVPVDGIHSLPDDVGARIGVDDRKPASIDPAAGPASFAVQTSWRRRSFETLRAALSGPSMRNRLSWAAAAGALLVLIIVISADRGQVTQRSEPVRASESTPSAPGAVPGVPASPSPSATSPAVAGLATPATEAPPPSVVVDKQFQAQRSRSAVVNEGAARAPTQRRQFTGTLAVTSEPPGSTVLVNGQPVGNTPVVLPRFRAGSHVVWIEREGYRRWTAAVQVVADRTAQVNATLEFDPSR